MTTTVEKTISAKDLRAKFTSDESGENKLRKAWVLQMPDEVKEKLKTYPGAVRIQLYKQFDKEVNDIYADNLRIARETALANGAKYERIDGVDRLTKGTVDQDEVLIESAVQWINKFISEL